MISNRQSGCRVPSKIKHRLEIYSTPARGFTAAVSVFIGTPPPKPLICKSKSSHSGPNRGTTRAKPAGGAPMRPSSWQFL